MRQCFASWLRLHSQQNCYCYSDSDQSNPLSSFDFNESNKLMKEFTSVLHFGDQGSCQRGFLSHFIDLVCWSVCELENGIEVISEEVQSCAGVLLLDYHVA